ncbi:MAG: hypothetical protein JKY65_27460, partial [Planctomycetes bacterium]|nr:hypothetical protein [Planctomycetota bacterium]
MKPRLILLVLGVAAAAAFLGAAFAPADPDPGRDTEQAAPSLGPHAVVIRQPTTPTVATGDKDLKGAPVEIQCSVCHTTRPPNPGLNAGDLDEFHQGLKFAHGSVGCLSCHDARDYDRLHLADGRSISYAQTIELCGQCHGPQTRDYRHGAHGGMRGHWDLTRGGRTRNHCVDCHDPHAPAYPK